MTIPSGKGRNGDLSIAIILLKSGSPFLTSFLGVYHRAAIKAVSRHCSPQVRMSPHLISDGCCYAKLASLCEKRCEVICCETLKLVSIEIKLFSLVDRQISTGIGSS